MTNDRARQIHDLKNYVGVIVGFAELILGDIKPGDPFYADLQEIQRAATQALQLVQELGSEQSKALR